MHTYVYIYIYIYIPNRCQASVWPNTCSHVPWLPGCSLVASQGVATSTSRLVVLLVLRVLLVLLVLVVVLAVLVVLVLLVLVVLLVLSTTRRLSSSRMRFVAAARMRNRQDDASICIDACTAGPLGSRTCLGLIAICRYGIPISHYLKAWGLGTGYPTQSESVGESKKSEFAEIRIEHWVPVANLWHPLALGQVGPRRNVGSISMFKAAAKSAEVVLAYGDHESKRSLEGQE